MRTLNGFHLVELLLTLSIIMILTSIAVPSYLHYVHEEIELEAEVSLHKLATALENYHLENHTYKNATLISLSIPEITTHSHYRLSIQTSDETSYLIAAIPTNKNQPCFTLDSLGTKSKTPC